MGPLRRNCAIIVQRWCLCPHHSWPGGNRTWETLCPAFVSYFRQALSGVSSSVFQILAPKYSERWFDGKDRTTVMMITFIGTGPFPRKGILTANLTSFQRTPSEACWVRCCHPHFRIRASRCVRLRSVNVVRMSTLRPIYKILLLAIMSTAVVPMGLLVPKAPTAPPCKDFLIFKLAPYAERIFSLSIF